MSASPKLPPIARDFLVYQRVVIGGASTRLVAEEAGVSQTRVRQIALRVMHWLVETLPADSELSEAAQLRLGQHIAVDRLEHFYAEANRAWLQTTQPKFANLCLRITAAQSKIPALPGALEALAMDAIVGPLPDSRSLPAEGALPDLMTQPTAQSCPPSDMLQPSESARQPGAIGGRDADPGARQSPENELPPVRDCSPSLSSDTAETQKLLNVPAITPPAIEPCDKLPPAPRAARNAFFAPAHLPDADGHSGPVTELKITPETLGFTTKKVLSRKERRRLRRIATTQ